MNKSNSSVPSAGTEVDSNSTAQNQHVSQPNANTNVSGCSYWVTPYLRYVRECFDNAPPSELRLQQMWQGSDGSQKWEFIDVVDLYMSRPEIS